ncbi:MAG TPA: pitrilysin family protein [Gemmatimonadales bacterium]|nr:pitrilysin family protein [Gemmatimonadales bacterium]
MSPCTEDLVSPRLTSVVLLLASLTLQSSIPAIQAQTPTPRATVDIPYKKFVLSNGLTLIVHEDRKAPIVAVNVWYHVGSKNERPGRTGFAHLFEHLMFNGTENYNKDFFGPLEQAGATDMNGTTNEDRTNYFENVPTNALDLALWMESDRMGHLTGAISQAKLDEQRGVVQNEKRQGENEPYGKVWDFLTPKLYPANHPYSWTVIGSMEDLDAAKLEDVKDWFQDYYGAANAVIVVAGDIHADSARQKVEHFFGDIPAGPPVARQEAWIAKRTGSQRGTIQDRVPQARVYKVWNIPGWGTAEADYLNLISDVLAQGKSSRLFKRLVYDDQIATDVAAYVDLREIGGLFVIEATARPGIALSSVESAVDEELGRLLKAGPTPEELRRVKTQYRAGFIRGVERIGGFGGKSDVLAQGQVFAGRPDFYKVRLGRVEEATAPRLTTAARQWLGDGVYTLEVHPYPEFKTASSTADRSKLPSTGKPVDTKFPQLERSTLSNGLKVVLARRQSIPQVRFDLLVDAGFAADQSGIPGTASLALAMMDEGTSQRNALEISDQLAQLGANLATGSKLDVSTISLEALKENLDPSLEIYADVVLNPSFPQPDLDRLKKQRLAQIQQEKADPVGLALRVFPGLLYGSGHAYSNPWTGSGTEESTGRIRREDLIRFHQGWFKPNHSTLIVVGATTMSEIRPKLERLFSSWKPGAVPTKSIATVRQPEPAVYIMDRPGSLQSVIIAGHVAPPKANPQEVAIQTLNGVLGSDFSSRINMNLREDKHWAYGAYTFFRDARGQRPFVAYAPVQTDKTKEALMELNKELRGIVKGRPIEAAELARAQASLTLTLPGSWETMGALSGAIADIVSFGLDDRYYDTFAEKVRAQTIQSLSQVADAVIHPEQLVWVIVGDRSKIEAGIRELQLGEIRLIDSNGKPTT